MAELADRLRNTRARIVVFFDGGRSPQVHLGSLSVRTSATLSADELILSEIGRAAAPREITVVTADRGLANRARVLEARILAPDEFWGRVGKTSAPSGEKPEGRQDQDTEEWIRYFEDEKNRRQP